jgi:hypothetical protein
MVADNPTDHQLFLEAFTGVRDLHSGSIGVRAHTANGDIDIMDAISFRDQFGVPPAIDSEGMVLRGLRIGVEDLDRAEKLLVKNGIGSQRHVGRLVVPPEVAYGATLIFEAVK